MEQQTESRTWSPQIGPQTELLSATWCQEILFGGARGGGKTDGLLGDYFQDYQRYGQHWQGVIFRRTYRELEEVISRACQNFLGHGEWKEGKKEFHFWNGARLRFRYLERNADADGYQGHQYSWIGWEELGQWASPAPYNVLKACLRWTAADVPTKRIRASANPGGPGHQWVKQYFIDHAPTGYVPRVDPATKHEIMFIPSRVEDNTILMERDPGYVSRLHGVGSPELVRAWLEGDWSVIMGAYFSERPMLEMVLRPFEIPGHWPRFRSFDWGSYRPFSVGWWTVSDGTIHGIPRGALIKYREWYGSKAPNVGLKLTVPEVARGIKEKEAPREMFSYSVADPAIFHEDGGPSQAETFRRNGIIWRPADNKRVPGWEQLRLRMKGDPETGKPLIFWFSSCVDSIRTIPALQHDDRKPEDVDTEGEDHAADETRYACMSRPIVRDAVIEEPARDVTKATLNELWEIHESAMGGIDRI